MVLLIKVRFVYRKLSLGSISLKTEHCEWCKK